MARTIPQIIGTLGIRPLARALGHKHSSTVQQWKARKQIPSPHLAAVVAASRALGKPISPEELVEAMRAAPSKRQRTA